MKNRSARMVSAPEKPEKKIAFGSIVLLYGGSGIGVALMDNSSTGQCDGHQLSREQGPIAVVIKNGKPAFGKDFDDEMPRAGQSIVAEMQLHCDGKYHVTMWALGAKWTAGMLAEEAKKTKGPRLVRNWDR